MTLKARIKLQKTETKTFDDSFWQLPVCSIICTVCYYITTSIFCQYKKSFLRKKVMILSYIFFIIMRLAKKCGIKFTFGTDAHSVETLSTIRRGDDIADAIGITENNLFFSLFWKNIIETPCKRKRTPSKTSFWRGWYAEKSRPCPVGRGDPRDRIPHCPEIPITSNDPAGLPTCGAENRSLPACAGFLTVMTVASDLHRNFPVDQPACIAEPGSRMKLSMLFVHTNRENTEPILVCSR